MARTDLLNQENRTEGIHRSVSTFSVTQGQRILIRILSRAIDFTEGRNQVTFQANITGNRSKFHGFTWRGGVAPHTDAIQSIPANSAPAMSFLSPATGEMEISCDLSRDMQLGASIEVLTAGVSQLSEVR